MFLKFCFFCFIVFILDLIGDKWLLFLIRDMLMYKKKFFKELVGFEEGIVMNFFFFRLKLLEFFDVIIKRKLFFNKKENIYLLIEKGMDLVLIFLEIVIWSDKYVWEYYKEMNVFENDNLDRI